MTAAGEPGARITDACARCEHATLVFDLVAIERMMQAVAKAARAARITPLFALKSFPHPRVRELAARHLAGFDVASLGELGDVSTLVADGSIVSVVDPTGAAIAAAAIGAGRVIVGCETAEHVHAAPRNADIAIRISASITQRDPAIGALLEGSGRRRSRFGLDDRAQIGELISLARSRGHRVGLHVHHGPVTATSAERFIASARAALALVDIEPAFLDLGGAWHGIADIAAAFAEIRAALGALEVIVEPGRLYAEHAGFATGRIVSTRDAGDRLLCVSELSRICHLRWSQVDLARKAPRPGEGRKVQIVGATCYEDDVIGEWIVEPAHVRERIVLANVSGYALAWNTSFGGVPAADVVMLA